MTLLNVIAGATTIPGYLLPGNAIVYGGLIALLFAFLFVILTKRRTPMNMTIEVGDHDQEDEARIEYTISKGNEEIEEITVYVKPRSSLLFRFALILLAGMMLMIFLSASWQIFAPGH